jgi:hypothetical protein
LGSVRFFKLTGSRSSMHKYPGLMLYPTIRGRALGLISKIWRYQMITLPEFVSMNAFSCLYRERWEVAADRVKCRGCITLCCVRRYVQFTSSVQETKHVLFLQSIVMYAVNI